MYLEDTPEIGVEGVEVHVEETENGSRRSWGGDIHAERIPPVPAMELHAENAVEDELPPSPALLVEQRHGREWEAFERRVVFSVGRQKARTYPGIVEERLSDAGSDFLEMNDVGRLGTLQYVIEDELGACDGLWVGLDVPRRKG